MKHVSEDIKLRAVKEYREGKIPLKKIAANYGVTPSTVLAWYGKYKHYNPKTGEVDIIKKRYGSFGSLHGYVNYFVPKIGIEQTLKGLRMNRWQLTKELRREESNGIWM